MKQYILLAGFLLIVIVTVVVVFFEDRIGGDYACARHEEFREERWHGTITRKYIDDSNHRSETFDISGGKSHVMFLRDSEFYQFIEVGDSLIKDFDTDTIQVFREDQLHRFKIEFGCE